MFVCNLKLDKKKLFRIFFVICLIIVILVVGISFYRILYSNRTTDELKAPSIANISSQNYTNILKTVHDNTDQYVGQKISFTGYVYRVYDFTQTEFVLARNMVISSDNQTVVVGFLCNHKDASNFADGSWVTITGKITKGDYHGSIPVIEVDNIKEAQKPADELVSPPDDTFVPTSALF